MVSFVITALILLGLLGAGFVGWLAPSPLAEPSPHWPLIVAYPSAIAAILFFIAALRLQHRLATIDRMANIKKGDVVKDKDINVSLLFQQINSDLLSNVTFERCTLRGPCLVALQGNMQFEGCSFKGRGLFKERLIEARKDRRYGGIGMIVHCTFRYCTFDNIAILATEEEIENIRKQVVDLEGSDRCG